MNREQVISEITLYLGAGADVDLLGATADAMGVLGLIEQHFHLVRKDAVEVLQDGAYQEGDSYINTSNGFLKITSRNGKPALTKEMIL
jgi:hypothetical protein